LLPYWLLFMLWLVAALQAERRRAQDPLTILFVTATVLTILMIGLRFEVGGDWGAYFRIYESIYFIPLQSSLSITDPGYAVVNWFAAQTNTGITFINLLCSALFMSGFARLAWKQPNPGLAVLVAVPYLIIVVAMGYTRQAAAIGIICFAIADASERHLIRLTILIGIAALFHKTAILILPITLVPIFRRSALFGAFGIVLFLVLFILLLRDTSDQLITNYVQSDYDSQGALIRVLMNVLAGLLFLLLRKHIDIPVFQKSFWTVCAIISIFSMAALMISSASSGVDRLSLYLIPLQAIVYSRLPYILSREGKSLPSVLIAVVGYSFLVQFVWLKYADNSHYWLPYSINL
jgi:hypothetical protein